MLYTYIRNISCILILGFVIFHSHVFINKVEAASNEEVEVEVNWLWPVYGKITDSFGTRGGNHKGIDIAAPMGTPIRAVAAGTVFKSYYSGTYGHVVFVRHENGMESVYAHLKKRYVSRNDKVEQGQVVGTLGNSGRSSGPHLHFELHKGEWNYAKEHAIDPVVLLRLDRLEAMSKEWQPATYSAGVVAGNSEVISVGNQKPTKIIVQKHDTLSELAVKYDVSIQEIMEWNSLQSAHLIRAGQILYFYPSEQTTTVSKVIKNTY
ncbi:LysM peptidoglycan-binding domain-containing protein [Bacillus sp. HMF5848]|uniref:peptidoglycan DD-metalloendopeptidase family protein n=1 Tax=Bacillus sp. HMF5848 TaxID=2495421 RepID=UPI000F7A9E33|nr:M23 family metallopeptidase [Bacillus sp. HMF5848]RSK27487.1 LysM peptidoglycan-binding domain-containing protein [Bacillus sp. HMF5848]